MVVTITKATRDSGGFVTVQGTITNNGNVAFNAVQWAGQEVAVVKSGPSVAGAVLVDEAGKKRYYVLRDTDGVCLCTTGLVGIQPKETRPFFAQFPAPPASTTQVQFEAADDASGADPDLGGLSTCPPAGPVPVPGPPSPRSPWPWCWPRPPPSAPTTTRPLSRPPPRRSPSTPRTPTWNCPKARPWPRPRSWTSSA